MTPNQKCISDHVLDNQRRYENYCRKLNQSDWRDLFQDFYIKVIELDPVKINLAYCHRVIYNMFINSKRHQRCVELQEVPGGETFNEERIQGEVIEAYIKIKLESKHDFLKMAIFEQAQTESLRSIERKTKIPLKSLSRYYHSARFELQKVAHKNLYL